MKRKSIQLVSIFTLICALIFIETQEISTLIILALIIILSLFKKERAALNMLCYLCLFVLLELWFRLTHKDTALILSIYAFVIVLYRDRGFTYVIVPLGIIVLTYLLITTNIILQEPFTAFHFGYVVQNSTQDENNNGYYDNEDILKGAYHQSNRKPKYKSAYYAGGYPPDTEGVCSDVIWRSILVAGYNLKELIDLDIDLHPDAYPYAEDANIDFRRVRNLITFFERNTYALPTTFDKKEQWQGGDIVFFSKSHVGILSDHYNQKGLPLLIHSAHPYQMNLEQDALESLNKSKGISGHYRWELNESGMRLLETLKSKT